MIHPKPGDRIWCDVFCGSVLCGGENREDVRIEGVKSAAKINPERIIRGAGKGFAAVRQGLNTGLIQRAVIHGTGAHIGRYGGQVGCQHLGGRDLAATVQLEHGHAITLNLTEAGIVKTVDAIRHNRGAGGNRAGGIGGGIRTAFNPGVHLK